MRGLVLAGERRIEVRDDLPEPTVEQPGDAVVRVLLAGLCGSDLHPWAGREPFLSGVVPGHEAVGEVVAVGPDVTRHGVGDTVVVSFSTSCGTCVWCRERGLSSRCPSGRLFGWGDPTGARPPLPGMQAEQVRVPLADGTLQPLLPGTDPATGVLLADNLPTGWYAARRADVPPGGAALVVGCGAVGLCSVAGLLDLDRGPVLASDPLPARRARATALGALAVAPEDLAGAVADLTRGEGLPSVVDAAGTASSSAAAVASLRPGGTLQVIAVPTGAHLHVTPTQAYDRNLTLRAGRAPAAYLAHELGVLLQAGRLRDPTSVLFTERPLPLAAGPEAYDRAASGADGVGKLLFDPSL
jgi:threonine dehydrogenase-like Zn-dependent dehydrogenase